MPGSSPGMMGKKQRAPDSFQVLHLLAELLDHGLEFKSDIGELNIVRFGAQGVRFAVEFLGEKVEAAPDRAALGDQALCLRNMGAKPVKLGRASCRERV